MEIRFNYKYYMNFFIILWCILSSGAWVIKDSKIILIINVAISLIIITYCAIKKLCTKNRYIIKITSLGIIISIISCNILLVIVKNGDYDSISSYINIISIFIISIGVSNCISFDDFKSIFTKIIISIAVISLVFAVFHNKMGEFAINFPDVIGQSASYKNMFIYLYPMYYPYRNTGVFWEPGAYQVFLNIALFFILNEKKVKRDIVKIVIIVLTIISTNSTAGLIILLINILIYIFSEKISLKNSIMIICMGVTMIVILTSNFFNYNISNKLLSSGTSYKSTSERLNGNFIDLEIMKRNPFIGVGLGEYVDEFTYVGSEIDRPAKVSCNTLTYIGAVYGIVFMILIFLGIVMFINSCKLNSISKIFSIVLFLIMIITENFSDKTIIYLLVFYGYRLYDIRMRSVIVNELQ